MRVCVADELDRASAKLMRARRRARLAGQLACPRAELGEVEPDELGRVRHGVPERERPLEVGESLCKAEDRRRLPRRLDRRGDCFRATTRRRPVGCQLRRLCRSAPRELVGDARVQFLALTGQDRRVDGFREEWVAEPEAVRRLIGDEDTVLDCLVQRLAHLRLAKSRDSAEERVPDIASDGRCHLQQALRLTVEPIHALQQQVAQNTRKLAALVARSREELFGEEGVSFRAGDDRVGQRRR